MEVKKTFPTKPMISYRSSRKISSYSKLHPINSTISCYKCGNTRCEVCKYIIETDTLILLLTLSQGKLLR